MEQGRNYRVITKGSGNLKPREMIASFVNEDADVFYFSLRPEAGTQNIPKKDVQAIYEAFGEKKHLPRIYRGEKRVL